MTGRPALEVFQRTLAKIRLNGLMDGPRVAFICGREGVCCVCLLPFPLAWVICVRDNIEISTIFQSADGGMHVYCLRWRNYIKETTTHLSDFSLSSIHPFITHPPCVWAFFVLLLLGLDNAPAARTHTRSIIPIAKQIKAQDRNKQLNIPPSSVTYGLCRKRMKTTISTPFIRGCR